MTHKTWLFRHFLQTSYKPPEKGTRRAGFSFLSTDLLDPQTEVEDAVWRVALPVGSADLFNKLGQRHIQLL